ncbi:PEP/pyruvate-binding domain-containing protein [Candidatus Poriferisodalis sp.]|uniref:PEP/pyruvate-binding domain-containing protein n=1 Tax=Candidatus Poriferisodalis sp. TaxID=3101277 RepID=UPI003B5A9035
MSPDSVTLSWDDPGDESITGYVILRRDKATQAVGTFSTVVADTGTADTAYIDAYVERNRRYVYRVQAINAAGTSERSNFARGYTPFWLGLAGWPERPAKPRGLAAETSHNLVTLSWDDPGDDSVTGYVILRRDKDTHDKGVFETLVPDTGTAHTAYVDATAQPDRRYVYRVKAINTTGHGKTAWTRGWTPPAPPPDPEPAAEDTEQPADTAAEDADAELPVWSATMTTERALWGFGYYSSNGTVHAGTLDPASFEEDGTTYTVTMVESAGWMYIVTDHELPFGFVLELDGQRFDSDDASFQTYSYSNVYRWNGTDLSWNAGDTVEIRLLRTPEEIRINAPATGAPTISGTAKVGHTLTADTSAIADPNGLADVSFAYRWLADDVDISGATGSTYILTDAEEGKSVKVRVSFTDDAGNDGILTSGSTDAVAPVGAQAQQLCSGGGYDPLPTEVEVEGVPIVVESTIDEYFVLYVRYDLDADSTVYLPVSVTLGQAGTTTLSENVAALPKERYQVHKYLVADPADVDGDCIDDITELADPVGQNPVNPAATIAPDSGALAVPDRETFEALSRQGIWDHHPSDWEYLKFILIDMETDNPGVYFMNTSPESDHQHHRDFLETLGIEWDRVIRGEIAYNPNFIAPNGNRGMYGYRLYPFNFSHDFGIQERSYRLLAASLPLLNDSIALYIHNDELPYSQADLPLYEYARINVVFDEDMYPGVDFQALNTGEGYGLLRVRNPDDRPHPREIVVYEALPHELPRVAGIITTAPQTPLSHINLRAVQDGVPNAFIRDALDNPDIESLLDNYVRYEVADGRWTLRAATRAEVDAHYAASRPATEQTPQRDLSVTQITALSDIEFDDWNAFGVKAANVAVLQTLGFPGGTVPDGFAVPLYFYDEFMKHNGFYDDIRELLADPEFQSDFDTQEKELKKLRKKIKKGDTPEWINTALTEMHAAYPEGQSLRYRSSTNNEDLPGFNGAGLYDSKTQHPEETEEDGIAKSLKQVFASLWNFRAFTEREFHRIDHLEAAMGVLVHPNYSDELANGVAVSFDPINARDNVYYANTQIGEDLVTNPEAHSVPEEILLYHGNYYNVLGTSNQVPPGQLLLTTYQLTQLRRHLEVIHDYFKELYKPASDEPFAMEIEFKITSEDILAIKQARPWVFTTR